MRRKVHKRESKVAMQKAGLSHPFHGWSMTGQDQALGREEQWQHWSSHLGTGRKAGFAGGKGAAPRVLEIRVPACHS